MYETLKKQNVIVEIKALVNTINCAKDDLDMYCEFMRERFLAVSGDN